MPILGRDAVAVKSWGALEHSAPAGCQTKKGEVQHIDTLRSPRSPFPVMLSSLSISTQFTPPSSQRILKLTFKLMFLIRE